MSGNVRLAWESIKKSKFRNVLTTLGIIIGVSSVITTVSIGDGVKHKIQGQIQDFGQDLIIVRPGRATTRDDNNSITNLNFLLNQQASAGMTDLDLEAVEDTENVRAAAPLAVISGVPTYEGREFTQGTVIATTSNLPEITNQKIAFGQFLSDNDEGGYYAVIGKSVAEDLFKQNVPIGRSISFRGKLLIVKGVFEEFKSNPFTIGADLNNAIFVPYTTGKILSQNTAQISQILAKPINVAQGDQVREDLEQSIANVRAGQNDFTVLSQEETLGVTNNILNIVTVLVGVMASIALLVGGVGIMNVMLVSVTERTKEIGIRKAIGATNRQILMQFLSEALLLSLMGSLIGVFIAAMVNIVLHVLTDMNPRLSWQIVAIAVGVSVAVGVLSGVAPAVKAARKDPIEALRNE